MTRRKLSKFVVACTLFAGLSACSTALDTKQIVSRPELGLVFFAEIIDVIVVKTDGVGDIQYQSVAGSTGEALADAAIAQADPTRLSAIAAFRTFVGALAGDLERETVQTRCLYIIRTTDERVTSSVGELVLSDFGDGDQIVFFENEDGERTSDSRSAEAEEPESEGEALIKQILSVPQTCDAKLKADEPVFLTISQSITTIHPVSENLRGLYETWEKAADEAVPADKDLGDPAL